MRNISFMIDLELALTYVLISVICFIISLLIARKIFSVTKFLKYQESQILLLAKIARANKVPESEIYAIFSDLEFSDIQDTKQKELQKILENTK